jgi:hypothetical protein
MLLSLFPTRQFLQPLSLDPVENQYIEEFRKEFKLDEREDQALDACGQAQAFDEKSAINTVLGVCDKVSAISWIPFCNSCKLANSRCQQVRAVIATGNIQEGVGLVKSLCADVTSEINSMRGGNTSDLMDYVKKSVYASKIGLQLIIAFMSALYQFKIILPAAMSLAPGLIRGAMKAKGCVPQSSIPGMFLIILPWLFCPLAWSVYQFAYQMLGNIWILFAVLIVSYAPMTYFIVGSLKHVTKPMSERQVISVMYWIGLYSNLSNAVALVAVLYYYYHEQKSDMYNIIAQFDGFNSFKFVLELVVSTLSKYLFTTIAGKVETLPTDYTWNSRMMCIF